MTDKPMPPGIRLVVRMPTIEEFCRLRIDVGWGHPPEAAVATALQSTLFAVCAETEDDQTIGMGRVVGDGGVQFFLTDVIVRKDWRNRGLGHNIVSALTDYVRSRAAKGTSAGLFSAQGREKFYERFGFVVRPNGRQGAGMSYPLPAGT